MHTSPCGQFALREVSWVITNDYEQQFIAASTHTYANY